MMAKTKRKLKRPKGRKVTRVARKPAKVSWLAKGYPVLSSVVVLDDCSTAIDWYKKVLGAKQRLRLDMPGGTVAHCELGFGDAVLMMGSPMPPQFPRPPRIYVRTRCDIPGVSGARARCKSPRTSSTVIAMHDSRTLSAMSGP
jgi:hypothetical protein